MANANKVVPIRPSVIGHFMAGITGQAVPPAGGPPPANPPQQGNANPVPPAANQQFGGGNGGGAGNNQNQNARTKSLWVLVMLGTGTLVTGVAMIYSVYSDYQIKNKQLDIDLARTQVSAKAVDKGISSIPTMPESFKQPAFQPFVPMQSESSKSESQHSSVASSEQRKAPAGTNDCLAVGRIEAGESCSISTDQFYLKWSAGAAWTQGASCSEMKLFDANSANENFALVKASINGSLSCRDDVDKFRMKFKVQNGYLTFSPL